MKINQFKSQLFILSSVLVLVVLAAIIFVPKAGWKNVFCGGFRFNKFATVFTTDDNLYNLAVQNNWTASGHAWGENIGWLTISPNISATVYVADDALSGYLYGENVGWISLSCRNSNTCGTTNYGVSNDAEGHLSGFAWGENIGWIDFGSSTSPYQVTISNGVFSGFAYGENVGWINFNSTSGGLMWSTEQVGDEGMNWNNAIATCGGTVDGSMGWRLPNIDELTAAFLPWNNNNFQGFRHYWSSSEDLDDNTKAWKDFYAVGDSVYSNTINKDDQILVRCVKNSSPVDLATTTWTARSTRAQCNDGIDNDADGLIDYPADTNCSTAMENNESAGSSGNPNLPRRRSTQSTSENVGGTIEPEMEVPETVSTTTAVTTSTTTLPTKVEPIKVVEEKKVVFTRNLWPGLRGEDVRLLQVYLNNKGFVIATSGVGSKGNESDYYGEKTKLALKKYQEYYKNEILVPADLKEGTGLFYELTRNHVNNNY